MEEMDRLMRLESLRLQPPAALGREWQAFEDWLHGLEGEEKERVNRAVSAFCLQEIGQTFEQVWDEAMKGLVRDKSREELPGLDAIMFLYFAIYRARQAARSRDGQ